MMTSTITGRKLQSLNKKGILLFSLVLLLNIASIAQTNVVLTTSGTWTVPANVFSVVVGCYGGGGGGGGTEAGSCTGAGGGGGGAFSSQTLAVSPGQVYNVTIGAGGTAGTINNVDGGVGGTTTFTGTGGTCSADGGPGGISVKSSDWNTVKPGVAGGSSGIGFLYAGGNGGASYDGSWSGSGGGGGGAGNGGPGGNATGSGNFSTGGAGGAGSYPGGAGASGWCCSINNKDGKPGNAPGGGGSGGSTGSCNSDPGHAGGAGGKGQVLLTYTACAVGSITATGAGTFCGHASLTATGGAGGTIYFQDTVSGGTSTATPGATQSVIASGTYYFRGYDGSCWGPEGSVTVTVTPGPCMKWLNQYCPTLPSGSYIDGGTFTPVDTLKSISTLTSTSSYGYVYWNFQASANTTYYFDLCSSAGTSGSSWLRLHNARNTSPSNNYCMDASNTPTLILENVANGCAGTGTGLSKLIWTCQASGTYYLESAVNASPSFWGYSGNQTATLSYKTLPSYSIACTDTFYDKGIDGTDGSVSSYNNNEDWIYTYYPLDTVADAINIQFTNFSTSPGDVLCVYNGNSINAPLIGCYSGPSITGAFSSTANDGSLTFRFTTDDSLISTGWQANVTCVASLNVGATALPQNIILYPNPAQDKLVISHQLVAIKEIEIYNAFGAIVYRSKLGTGNLNPETTIDINALRSGIYFISAMTEAGKWNGKFVKQ